MRWLDLALDEVVRRQAERDSALANEVAELKQEIERLRMDNRRDRFWTHVGVEATLIALGLAWWTLPKQTLLGGLEGIFIFAIAVAALIVTVVRNQIFERGGRPCPDEKPVGFDRS